jgi:hypothetical protein
MRATCILALGAVLCLSAPWPARAQVQISWSTQGEEYGYTNGQPTALSCPAGGTAGRVYGTDTYTDDSSICTAAVHAGLITLDEGGTIILHMRPGLARYPGTRRNGIASTAWQAWHASFILTAPPKPPPAPPPKPAPPPVISWKKDAVGLGPNGRRFTFVCRPPALPGVVKGVDLYAWDSSICTSAVHAGVITSARGGTVTIEMRPGQDSYAGSARNGITSTAGTKTILGFVVVGR